MSQKKWLFVLPWEISYPGGVNQVVSNLLVEFDKDPEVKGGLLIDCHYKGNDENTGVDRILLSNPFWSPGLIGFVKYIVKIPGIFLKLRTVISDDVVCVNSHYPSLNVINYIFYKRVFLCKWKIVLSFHGLDIKEIETSVGMERRFWLYVFQKVDAIVFCSYFLAQHFLYLVGDKYRDKIRVIHNGINPDLLARESAGYGLLPNGLDTTPFILNVATFEYKKGQDLLIKSFSKIRHVHNVKLCLIGREASELDYYKALVRDLGCEEDVFFFENVKHRDVMAFFKKARFFCLPSRFEPFGIVLLESGFLGCPVVATNVGGIPEIITDGYDGYLFESEDVDELTSVLDTVLRNPERAEQSAVCLKEKIIRNFTWHYAAEKYLKILSD